MKKTITINLAGVVFHIEEDAFEALQKYLDSVKHYFSKVEGGADIQGDIEARIAEIFSGSITESNQAITLDDVSHVIRQLGTVEDILGDELDGKEEFAYQQAAGNTENQSGAGSEFGSKRLYRDVSNQIVGGVCSGIAAYFETNPLWIRLAYVALFFGISFLPSFAGFLFLGYVVLWIAMPAKANLENHGKFKRFFRSRKDKIVGGVSAGVGSYFGIDPVIVRIIFFAGVFAGGAGLIIYLIMWAITPEAQSVTDELQMKGNAVTLNNIEEQIRKNVKMEDKAKESTVVNILTFPFKLIGMIFSALGPFMRFVFDALRVLVAILLFIIGGLLLFGILVLAGASMGIINAEHYHVQMGDLDLQRFAADLSPWMVAFPAITALVPITALILVSLSLMARRVMFRPLLGMGMVALFVVGLVGSGFTLIPLFNKFKRDGYSVEKTSFVIPYSSFNINLNRVDGLDEQYYPLDLQIVGYDGKEVMLTKRMEAQGSTFSEATSYAKGIKYNVALQDSTLIFDSGLTLDGDVPFRFQRLDLKLLVPFNKPFTMSPEIGEILHNTLYPNGYDTDDLEGNIWIFDENRGLKCLTCKRKHGEDWDTPVPPASPDALDSPDVPASPDEPAKAPANNEDEWD